MSAFKEMVIRRGFPAGFLQHRENPHIFLRRSSQPHTHRLEPLHTAALAFLAMQGGVHAAINSRDITSRQARNLSVGIGADGG